MEAPEACSGPTGALWWAMAAGVVCGAGRPAEPALESHKPGFSPGSPSDQLGRLRPCVSLCELHRSTRDGELASTWSGSESQMRKE